MPRPSRKTVRVLARSAPGLLVATLLFLAARAQPTAAPDWLAPPMGRLPEPASVLAGPTCPTVTAVVFNPVQPYVNPANMYLSQPGIPPSIEPSGAFAYVQPASGGSAFYLRYSPLDMTMPDPFPPTYPFHITVRTAASPGWVFDSFGRAIVTQNLTGIAQPTPGMAAYSEELFGTGGAFAYDPAAGASSVTLTAVVLDPATGNHTALPGTNPRLAISLCEDGSNPGLWVTQQVIRVDGAVLPPDCLTCTSFHEMVQTFTVPSEVLVNWVELALPSVPSGSPPALGVTLLDPQTIVLPPPDPIVVTPTAAISSSLFPATPAWVPATPFATPVDLVPNHTYWLVLETDNKWVLGGDKSGSGFPGQELMGRDFGGSSLYNVTGTALSFRMIGTPKAPVAVTGGRHPLLLSAVVGPNPFRNAVFVRWSGGTGRLGIRVYDVTGKQVRQVPDAGAAVAGQWHWDGADDQGRRLASGTYFVRITDERGSAARRVVLIR